MRKRLVALLLVAFSAASALLITATPVAAACALGNGDDYVSSGVRAGGGYVEIPGLPVVTGAQADLWNYTPDPVYGDISFWVMTEIAATQGQWAQIGWTRTPNTPSYIFLQYTDNSGNWFTRFPNCDTGFWVGPPPPSATCTANAMYNYKVYKDYGNFWFTWGTFPTYAVTAQWNPDKATIAGEVHDIDLNENMKGEHFPGHQTNHIHAENTKVYRGGNWNNGAYQLFNELEQYPYYINWVAGVEKPSFYEIRVWDKRCDS